MFLNLQVITHILQFVSFDDRKRARLVNSVWYYSSIHPMFIKNELFTIDGPKQTGFVDQVVILNDYHRALKESKRKVLNIRFRGFGTLHKCTLIFQDIAENVREIYLEDIHVLTNAFIHIITNCCNLKMLEFRNITRWCLPVDNLKPIHSLKTLVYKLGALPNNVFNLLASLASNIEALDLDYLVFNTTVSTPYCNVNRNSVLQFLHKINNLSNLRVNDNCWILNILPKRLRLMTLSVNYQRYYTDAIELFQFESVIREHKSLLELEVFAIPCCLLQAIRDLKFLQHLNLTYAKYHIYSCFDKQTCLKNFRDSFNEMKYLKTLSLTSELPIRHEIEFVNCIPSIPLHILKSLQSLDCYLSPDMGISTFGNNLTNLRIRNGNILIPADFKLLFKQLTKLRDLWIEKCYKLNDDVFLNHSLSNLKGNEISQKY